jgi:hypothetical protein
MHEPLLHRPDVSQKLPQVMGSGSCENHQIAPLSSVAANCAHSGAEAHGYRLGVEGVGLFIAFLQGGQKGVGVLDGRDCDRSRQG